MLKLEINRRIPDETKTESLSIIYFDCGSKWNHSAMTKCNTGTRLMMKPKSTAQQRTALGWVRKGWKKVQHWNISWKGWKIFRRNRNIGRCRITDKQWQCVVTEYLIQSWKRTPEHWLHSACTVKTNTIKEHGSNWITETLEMSN